MIGLFFGLVGALIGAAFAVLGAVFGVGLALFIHLGPILLIALIVWLLVRDKHRSTTGVR